MISRGQWRGVFLTALEEKTIAVGDLPATTIRALVQSKDDLVRNRIGKLISRYQEADADKLKLIREKRKVVLDGEADLAAGHEIAKDLLCHKFYGEGAGWVGSNRRRPFDARCAPAQRHPSRKLSGKVRKCQWRPKTGGPSLDGSSKILTGE
jgi:hypothetical protein